MRETNQGREAGLSDNEISRALDMLVQFFDLYQLIQILDNVHLQIDQAAIIQAVISAKKAGVLARAERGIVNLSI